MSTRLLFLPVELLVQHPEDEDEELEERGEETEDPDGQVEVTAQQVVLRTVDDFLEHDYAVDALQDEVDAQEHQEHYHCFLAVSADHGQQADEHAHHACRSRGHY